MYLYYTRLGFVKTKHNEEGKYIHIKTFNNIPNIIKKDTYVNCIHGGFVTYNDSTIIEKLEVIPPITYSRIPVYFYQKNKDVVTFNTEDVVSKLE